MLDELYRAEHGRILATLVRQLGDIDLAEESLHEAFAAAIESWGASPPASPRAWLIGTARHKAIDRLRRETRLAAKREEIARQLTEEPEAEEPTDRLRLI